MLAVEMIHHLRRDFAHAHDVVDAHPLQASDAEIGIGLGVELFLIAQHRVHFRHGGIGFGLGLRGAAGDDDARAAGCSRLSLRMAWRDWRTASAVTAQVLTTTAVAQLRLAGAQSRIASLS